MLASERQTAPVDRRRWLVLGVIAVAQLMIALDATVVSIALPSAQHALSASNADRQWVITAYTLAFGSLLLLGGRVADAFGRRRVFILALAGFALASAVGGAAPSLWVLIAARALQGAFAAVLAPTALSLLAVTFTEPRDRARAFAVYGAIAGSGAAVGLLLGGALTQFVDWRWCLYVNVPIAALAAIGAARLLPEMRPVTGQPFDIPGVVLAIGGLTALVYACTESVTAGWASPAVIGLLIGSLVLLGGFAVRQTLAAAPLLPPRIVLDRNRGGAYLTVALAIAGMFGAFFFLTYYLQAMLRYTPLQAGLAFLPLSVATQVGSWAIASRLMPHVPSRALMAPGALVAGGGMLLLTQVHGVTAYLMYLLPAQVLLGLGMACVMVPAFSVGTFGVDRRQAGVAAATVQTASQVGASLGSALLNQALVHGYSVAAVWGAGIFLLAAVASGLLISARPSGPSGRAPSANA